MQLEALVPAETSSKDVLSAKDTLVRYFTTRCVNCKRASQDDIRIKKTPKNCRPELTAATDTTPNGPCSQLPEAVEDTLRRLLNTVTGLDPLDAMLLLWVAKGGTPGTFGRFLNATFTEARLYGPTIGRATAKAKWTAICKKFGPFAALRSWGIGHGGRTTDDVDGTEETEETYIQGEMDL